jgi:hypothetical protein
MGGNIRPGQARGPWTGICDDTPGSDLHYGDEIYEIVTVTTPGQTSFNLTNTPFSPGKVRMFPKGGPEQVNGTGRDFTIAANVLNYTGSVVFQPGDEIIVKYFK